MNSNSCWFEPVWKRKIELEEENRNRKGRNQTQVAAQLAHGPSLFFLFPPGPTDHTSPACPPSLTRPIKSPVRPGPPRLPRYGPAARTVRLNLSPSRLAPPASASPRSSHAAPRARPPQPLRPGPARHARRPPDLPVPPASGTPLGPRSPDPTPFSSLTERAHASAPPPSSRNGCARHAAFPGEIPHARRARQGRRRPIRRVPSLFHTPHPHLRRQ